MSLATDAVLGTVLAGLLQSAGVLEGSIQRWFDVVFAEEVDIRFQAIGLVISVVAEHDFLEVGRHAGGEMAS